MPARLFVYLLFIELSIAVLALCLKWVDTCLFVRASGDYFMQRARTIEYMIINKQINKQSNRQASEFSIELYIYIYIQNLISDFVWGEVKWYLTCVKYIFNFPPHNHIMGHNTRFLNTNKIEFLMKHTIALFFWIYM